MLQDRNLPEAPEKVAGLHTNKGLQHTEKEATEGHFLCSSLQCCGVRPFTEQSTTSSYVCCSLLDSL